MNEPIRDCDEREILRSMGDGMHPPWPPLLKGGKEDAPRLTGGREDARRLTGADAFDAAGRGSRSSDVSRRVFLDRSTAAAAAALAGLGSLAGTSISRAAQKEVLPKHITPETLKAVVKGLDYLQLKQSDDGSWVMGGGEGYPVAMTALAGTAMLAHGNSPTRGKYAKSVQGAIEYLVRCATATGLITGSSQDGGQPMHGHGFALMFLACVYGMITKESLRQKVQAAVRKAVALTSQGQSLHGGWTYIPGAGDEGSVTVTQVQALRAAHNAGFLVPRATIEEAVKYLERCRTPEGGIQYSLLAASGPRLPISAAAVATLYNAGQFDSSIATDCLKYVWAKFSATEGWDKGDGHSFYAHLYAAQGFYMAGDQYWDKYFPATRDQLLAMQQPEGSWNGDGVGTVYGTSIATIILQLPYKYLPIFQR